MFRNDIGYRAVFLCGEEKSYIFCRRLYNNVCFDVLTHENKNNSPLVEDSNFCYPTQNDFWSNRSKIKYSDEKNNVNPNNRRKDFCAKAHRTSPNSDILFFITKTLLCIRSRASLTVEASMVIPALVLFLVLFLGFFRVMMVESQVNEALSYATTKLSMETIDVLDTYRGKKVFVEMLKEQGCTESHIQGGFKEMYVSSVQSDDQYVRLTVTYDVILPVNFFGKHSIEVTQVAVARRWTGYCEADSFANQWVYITPFGTVYHTTAGCSYLDLSVWSIAKDQVKVMRNKDGARYYSCSLCKNEKTIDSMGTVYITDYGRFYHLSLDCMALKRTVLRVPIDKIGSRSLCKKCG